MSIWGKLVGGLGGLALGGPLGAIIGVLAGHALDHLREPGPDAAEAKSAAFTIAVVVLGAKLAKSDGVVTKDEIRAFKRVFQVPKEDEANVAKLFNHARETSAGFEPYARQVAQMFRANPAVLEELLECLAEIARADGTLNRQEIAYLRAVAETFGLDQAAFERVTAIRAAAAETDPYKILGVSRGIRNDDLKAAYRNLVRENHPDRLIAQGMPEEFVAVANRKLAAINDAYDKVCKERGI